MNPTVAQINWISTYTGRHFDYVRPDAEQVSIVDIAHSLAKIPRFNGHTNRFYSVAQHCMMVANVMMLKGYPEEAQMHALLHDAAEAYLCDIPSPLKKLIKPCYGPIEDRVEKVIYEKYGINPATYKRDVKEVDWAMCNFEAHSLVKGSASWVDKTLVDLIGQWYHIPQKIKDPSQHYLAHFTMLGGKVTLLEWSRKT